MIKSWVQCPFISRFKTSFIPVSWWWFKHTNSSIYAGDLEQRVIAVHTIDLFKLRDRVDSTHDGQKHRSLGYGHNNFSNPINVAEDGCVCNKSRRYATETSRSRAFVLVICNNSSSPYWSIFPVSNMMVLSRGGSTVKVG